VFLLQIDKKVIERIAEGHMEYLNKSIIKVYISALKQFNPNILLLFYPYVTCNTWQLSKFQETSLESAYG